MAPKPGNKTTRERIIAYLEEHRTVSVQTLSRSWRLTAADIRYHLSALIDEGLVERVPRDLNQAAKRGRPAQHYRLSNTAVPNNFALLCSTLLKVLHSGSSPESMDQVLRAAAVQMAGQMISSQDESTASTVQRLNRSIEYLGQAGYRARWEASPSGPRVLLRGCPYAAIIDQHPQLCRIDRFLLETLTGLPFRQTAMINPFTGSPAACVFLIHQDSKMQDR